MYIFYSKLYKKYECFIYFEKLCEVIKKIPKSKKGNENWTFIKCPDFGTQIKFQKTLFFHIVTNML
jgi:hypothetical protein